MTLRTKLISIIVAFVMVASLMMVSIFASPTITMQMGGNVSFNATDLQVTISDGVLANGTLEDSANKMKGVKIDAYDDGAEELATWQNLNLIFNESGQDMTITFTITNNSKTDNVKAAVSVNQGTATNATVSLTTPSTSPATIQANNGSQQFVITFHVVDRNSPASITGFQIDIDLEKESGSGSGSTDTESYTVTFNDIEDEDNTNTYYIKSDISDTIYEISSGETIEIPVKSLLMLSWNQTYLDNARSTSYGDVEPYIDWNPGHGFPYNQFKVATTLIAERKNLGLTGYEFSAEGNDVVNAYTNEGKNVLYITIVQDIVINIETTT